MITVDRVIVVEGKYDKIKLENIIDATIITTNGFSLFKDKEKKALIRRLAKEKGIAVLTDSDNAGNMIRAYLKNICGNTDIVNIYIPQIKGKERRKARSAAQGLLGVEGIEDEILLSCFKRAGLSAGRVSKKSEKLTKQDLYTLGLLGTNNAKKLREDLSGFLEIPKNLSSSAFLDAVNSLYTKAQAEERVRLWRQEADKN